MGSAHLDLRRRLDALGPVDLAVRVTPTRILCGDCGPSQMMRDGTCASCAGHGWMPDGRGWLFLFRDGEHAAHLIPVGGSRLRLSSVPRADEPIPVEAEPAPLPLAS